LDLSRQVLARDYRVGTFWLLQRVYRHLLHGRVERNVRPMTDACLQAKELECSGKEQSWWPDFEARLSPATALRYATPADEVDATLRLLGVDARDLKQFVQGRGFRQEGRHRGSETNLRLYVYCFPGPDGRKGEATWLRMD
jgi:hypothetical protein